MGRFPEHVVFSWLERLCRHAIGRQRRIDDGTVDIARRRELLRSWNLEASCSDRSVAHRPLPENENLNLVTHQLSDITIVTCPHGVKRAVIREALRRYVLAPIWLRASLTPFTYPVMSTFVPPLLSLSHNLRIPSLPSVSTRLHVLNVH